MEDENWNQNPVPADYYPRTARLIIARPRAFACFLYLVIIVFWSAMLIIGGLAIVSTFRHFNGVGQILGGAVALFVSIWQLLDLSRFPLRTTLDGDSLRTVSLRGKKSISLSNITKLETRSLAASRYGSLDCLKCSDNKGTAIFLEMASLSRSKRTEVFAPLVDRFKLPVVHYEKDVASLWRGWYSYTAAPTDPAFPVDFPDTKAEHVSRIATLIIIIFVLLILAGLAYMQYVVPSRNTAAASPVASEYVRNLEAGSVKNVTSLESPHLQADAEHRQFLLTTHFSKAEQFKLIDSHGGRDSQGYYVTYVYEDDGGSSPYYLKIALSKYNNEWRVWFFETSYAILQANN